MLPGSIPLVAVTNKGVAPLLSNTFRTFLATIRTALVGKTNKTISAPSNAFSKSPVAGTLGLSFQFFI